MSRVREYWIRCEAYQHNPIHTGRDDMMGMPAKRPTIWALRYRAYTPGFGVPLPGSADLGPNEGIPGPVIRAEVGDTIVVHFQNRDDHYRQPHSIRVFGVRCDAANDGAWTPMTAGPASLVPFGGEFTYRWACDSGSVGSWSYQDSSRPFLVGDPAAVATGPQSNIGYELGLVGFVVVEPPGRRKPDRDFFVVFHAYLNDIPGVITTMDINGRAFLGNTPDFTARVGERVRWHVMGARQTYDHNFHVHGHRWRTPRGYEDVVTAIGDDVEVVEWIEDNPGRWLYHCHVEAHMEMTGWYVVEDAQGRADASPQALVNWICRTIPA